MSIACHDFLCKKHAQTKPFCSDDMCIKVTQLKEKLKERELSGSEDLLDPEVLSELDEMLPDDFD